jgi:hypothetical protein
MSIPWYEYGNPESAQCNIATTTAVGVSACLSISARVVHSLKECLACFQRCRPRHEHQVSVIQIDS